MFVFFPFSSVRATSARFSNLSPRSDHSGEAFMRVGITRARLWGDLGGTSGAIWRRFCVDRLFPTLANSSTYFRRLPNHLAKHSFFTPSVQVRVDPQSFARIAERTHRKPPHALKTPLELQKRRFLPFSATTFLTERTHRSSRFKFQAFKSSRSTCSPSAPHPLGP